MAQLLTNDVGRLPSADGAVDRVLTVGSVYFCSDLGAFGEVRRVLAPGGRLVVAIRDMKVMQAEPNAWKEQPRRLEAAI